MKRKLLSSYMASQMKAYILHPHPSTSLDSSSRRSGEERSGEDPGEDSRAAVGTRSIVMRAAAAAAAWHNEKACFFFSPRLTNKTNKSLSLPPFLFFSLSFSFTCSCVFSAPLLALT